MVEQGSDFEVDRRLRHRAHYDFRELLRRRFGSAGATLVEALLRSSGGGPSGDFLERFENARTEGDVDRAYRDLVLVWEVRAPLFVTAADVAGRALFGAGAAELDPIRTLGPMQVSVAWAAARTDTNPADPELRAILASRRGGLVVGVARLFATSRKYADPAFLVADYNAGLFASRNAAFQEELSEIEGVPLPLDGDLLSYRPDGTARAASQTLAALERFAREERLAAIGVGARADLELEKSAAFESTASWHAVRAEWSRRRGAEAPYARLPAVRFESLHDSRPTTVGAYVRHVMEKYRRCLALTPGGRDSAR